MALKAAILCSAMLVLSLHSSDAIKCYVCTLDICKDPYSPATTHEFPCSTDVTKCAKLIVSHESIGSLTTRSCSDAALASTKDEAEKAGILDQFSECEGDFCNGSSVLGTFSILFYAILSIALLARN